jgi:hypothetical protein
MRILYRWMISVRRRSQVLAIVFPLCIFTARSSLAQSSSPPSGNSRTNPLAVEITTFDNKIFHAPANISIIASVSLNAPASKGDSVRVDFFANNRRLGSKKSFWRKGMGPDPHSRNAQPMIMSAAGFDPVELVWRNAPTRRYTLTARAIGAKGLAATSPPISITVLPSTPP